MKCSTETLLQVFSSMRIYQTNFKYTTGLSLLSWQTASLLRSTRVFLSYRRSQLAQDDGGMNAVKINDFLG